MGKKDDLLVAKEWFSILDNGFLLVSDVTLNGDFRYLFRSFQNGFENKDKTVKIIPVFKIN